MMKKCGFITGLCLVASLVFGQTVSLDEAIVAAVADIQSSLAQGTKVAVLNFNSDSERFSDYVIEEIAGAMVSGKKLVVVDRQSIELIQKEMNLQLSGEVSDESAQRIGAMLGAQSIVSGSLVDTGAWFRFRVNTINVETAQRQVFTSKNIDASDRQVVFLLTGQRIAAATPTTPVTPAPAAPAPAASSPTAPATPAQRPVTPTPAPAAPVAPVAQPAAPPAPSSSGGDMSRAGLYVGTSYQGQMDLYDALDWIAMNAQNGGNYSIVLGQDMAITYANLNFNNKRVTVSLRASGGQRKVSFELANRTYPLFTVSAGVTFTLEDGVVLSGTGSSNSKNLVRVAGGTFIMNGGTISGNTVNGNGGGVVVETGTFTMNGGTISGNIASGGVGGGVYVAGGTFTMNGGTISGNTASGGGGVFVGGSGTFTKPGTGGIIYGSNAPEGQANKASGGGPAVYTSNGRRRNTTARVSTALDSSKSGEAGGWEN